MLFEVRLGELPIQHLRLIISKLLLRNQLASVFAFNRDLFSSFAIQSTWPWFQFIPHIRICILARLVLGDGFIDQSGVEIGVGLHNDTVSIPAGNPCKAVIVNETCNQ